MNNKPEHDAPLRVLASLLSSAAPAGYRLTVEVENVRNAQGVVGVLVFNTAQGWPEQFSAALRAQSDSRPPRGGGNYHPGSASGRLRRGGAA